MKKKLKEKEKKKNLNTSISNRFQKKKVWTGF